MNDSLYTLTLTSPFAGRYSANSDADDNESSNQPDATRYDYGTDILTYTTEPTERPTESTYGVELEFNPRGGRTNFVTSVDAVFAGCPHFFVKSDCSISVDGGEIVTTPRTLGAHNKMFGLIEEHAAGFRAATTCGFHVHALVPNNLFTTARVYQFIASPALSAFVTAIAKRPANSYCYRSNYAIGAPDATRWASNRRADHSSAFTFSGKGTVEFRIFASHTKRYMLSSYVEFADALLTFCSARPISSDPSLALDGVVPVLGEFLKFVLDNSTRYPNLAYRLNLPTMRAVIAATLRADAPFDNSLFRKQLTVTAPNGNM